MSDNCQNNWGSVLGVGSTKHLGKSTYADERVLRDMITATFKSSFVLCKVMSSGSDANMYALNSATNGDSNSLLVAAGSYVSGDNGAMQSMSTSDFSLRSGFSGIAYPSTVLNEFTRRLTVALPYCIDGVLEPKNQCNYENNCMKQLHLRCLLAMVKRRPIRVILLELMLASNGASLSDRFLIMLGNIATSFGIHFIVDEIMTAGRSGKMLMLQHKPEEFQKRVTHVTMGKWTKKGLVLVSRDFNALTLAKSSHTEPRMLSHPVECRDVIMHWSTVRKNLSTHQEVREKVLTKIKIREEDTWGIGALMFVPLKRSGLNEGLLNRLLPQLDKNLPVDVIKADRKLDGLSKKDINDEAVHCVKQWIKDRNKVDDEEDQHVYLLLKYLAMNSEKHLEFSTIRDNVFPGDKGMAPANAVHRVQAANLLLYKMVGVKRCRRWIVHTLCNCKNFIIP